MEEQKQGDQNSGGRLYWEWSKIDGYQEMEEDIRR